MILSIQQIQLLVDEVYPVIFTDNAIPKSLLCGQIIHESSGDTTAFAKDRNGGSTGLMQIDRNVMTAIGFPSDTDLTDPLQNVKAGFTYMKLLFNGKLHNADINNLTDKAMKFAMTLVCYNCGYSNFNMMYKNHLSSNPSDSWNDDIQYNISLVDNWSSCLVYPVAVITQANKYFGFTVDDFAENDILGQVPLFHAI